MIKKNQKFSIGIFDSGFGGLNIMRAIVKQLPDYDYIYLGDTARTPYGSRSQEIIYNFTKQAVEFLFKKDCQLVIIACNTASSQALRKIQMEWLPAKYPDRKVLGVIIPTAEEAIGVTKNMKIGIMATEATVHSRAFANELKKLNSKVSIYQQACPLFVPLIESNERGEEIIENITAHYLKSLIKNKIDTLILGCTHYGYLKKYVKRIAPTNLKIIVEDEIVARKLKKYLANHIEIEKKISRKKQRKFYTTDLTDKFAKFGSRFYGQKINPEKIVLE